MLCYVMLCYIVPAMNFFMRRMIQFDVKLIYRILSRISADRRPPHYEFFLCISFKEGMETWKCSRGACWAHMGVNCHKERISGLLL